MGVKTPIRNMTRKIESSCFRSEKSCLLKIETLVRKPVDTCANYLLKYSPYLRYNEYLKQGMPIATGVIEGACRHLIKDRMDITGA